MEPPTMENTSLFEPRDEIKWQDMEPGEIETAMDHLMGGPDGQPPISRDQVQVVADKVRDYRDHKTTGVIAEAQKVLKGPQVRGGLEMMLQAILTGTHILSIGTSGIGKTKGAEVLSKIMNVPVTRYDAQPDTSDAELVGTQIFHQDKFTWVPGFITQPAMVAMCDELPRIPATTAGLLLAPMAERRISVPDLGGKGRRTFRLSPNWTVVATGNPIGYGGTASRNEAVWDRFGMGLDQPHPSADARVEILEARNLIRPPVLAKRPLPVALNAIRAALWHVSIDRDLIKQLLNGSFLVSPPSFRRKVRYEQCFFRPINKKVEQQVRELEGLTEENLIEGSNPRGEELMLSCARARPARRAVVRLVG